MRQSANVEDRRRLGPRAAVGGGLGGLALILIALLFGVNPMALMQGTGGVGLPGGSGSVSPYGGPGGISATGDAQDDELARFTSAVLGDTEDVWLDLFRRMGRRYVEPTLVLFRGQVQSACGSASAAVGPFYCPGDSKVYIDLSFFDELGRRFQAPGDFAQAYVIAHEIGHHVQNLMGVSDQVHALRGRVSQEEYNAASVRLELQADFYAGVWAHHAQRMRDILESGDVEEGLRAAAAIGDDRLQRQAQGYVVPDSFTHGTSEQRVRWFRLGLETGDLRRGDTFSDPDP
jgi:predicted metalloprotease